MRIEVKRKMENDREYGRRRQEKKEREKEREKEKDRERKPRRRNDLVGLSETSFIFSSRLNIKDNLIIEGFSKASRLFVPSRSSFLYASFYPFICQLWVSRI